MAEKNKLASIPGQPLPERKGNFLSDLWDEASGAFARYGRRSAAQRDASLALLNQAVDPNTDPLSGAAQKVLGLAGLVTHPLAFFPTREEWDQRLQAAGNDGRVSRSIGGFLSDLPNLIDPQMAAGGAVLAAAPIVGKLAKPGKTLSHSELLARGADGHLSSAREMQIPVSKVVGREPTPAAAEGMPYVKGRPITQPIEVEYNAADDTYTLYAGNHRITQAELNGDEFIPAFVQGDNGKFGESRLGRGLGELMQDAANNKELDALGARLQAEAAQTGGAPSSVSREQALESMLDQPPRRQLTTQSYKETLPDGTEQWVPGTLRVNPPTSRFNSEMSIADIKRYIELYGEPPPPRAKGEVITGKRKDVYPDGTAVPVPGLLRTKRPALNAMSDRANVQGMSKKAPSFMEGVSTRLREYIDDVNKHGQATGAEKQLSGAKIEAPEDVDALLSSGASRAASEAVAQLGKQLGFNVKTNGASDTSFYMTFSRPIGEQGPYGTPEEYFTVRVSDHPNTTRTRVEQPDLNYAPGIMSFSDLERMLRNAKAKNRDAVINDLDAPEMDFSGE